jgi:hypothetical protein
MSGPRFNRPSLLGRTPIAPAHKLKKDHAAEIRAAAWPQFGRGIGGNAGLARAMAPEEKPACGKAIPQIQSRGHRSMSEEPNIRAELLTGYQFYPHPNNPTLGVLRLDTRGEPRWVLVTRKGLLELARACAQHADELIEAQ